jgi:hypothetical protein
MSERVWKDAPARTELATIARLNNERLRMLLLGVARELDDPNGVWVWFFLNQDACFKYDLQLEDEDLAPTGSPRVGEGCVKQLRNRLSYNL